MRILHALVRMPQKRPLSPTSSAVALHDDLFEEDVQGEWLPRAVCLPSEEPEEEEEDAKAAYDEFVRERDKIKKQRSLYYSIQSRTVPVQLYQSCTGVPYTRRSTGTVRYGCS